MPVVVVPVVVVPVVGGASCPVRVVVVRVVVVRVVGLPSKLYIRYYLNNEPQIFVSLYPITIRSSTHSM